MHGDLNILMGTQFWVMSGTRLSHIALCIALCIALHWRIIAALCAHFVASQYIATLCASEVHPSSSLSLHSWDQGVRPPIHRHIVCHQIMAGKSSLEQESRQGFKKFWTRRKERVERKCLWKYPDTSRILVSSVPEYPNFF